VQITSPREAFDLGISTIHQEFNLVPYLDVASNIFLGRENRNICGVLNKKAAYKHTEALLEQVGARVNPKSLIKDLGVAEKQMVEICKALSINSRIVIMDEPTAVLSVKEIEKLFTVINSIKAKGISIIYISHHLEELMEIADRVTALRDGEIIGTLQKSELTKPLITKMMIGRDLSEQYPRSNKKIGDKVLKVEGINRAGTLKDISFEVRSGEILGFSGLVGSGRTEVARAIIGADTFDSGAIYLNGKKVKIETPVTAKKLGMALVPEERKSEGLVLSLSVEKNISLPYLKKINKSNIISKKKVAQLSDELVKRLNIRPDNTNIRVRNLSGGNQQKVAIAKWMYEKHSVIIFDEPTRGVDVGAKAEIYKLMNEIASQGVAIIMISSDLPEIIGMSDRVIVMKEGEIIGELRKEELSEQAVMNLAF
jgi:ABC-type sugar transport system ATPase subunit